MAYGEFVTDVAPDTCPATTQDVKDIFTQTYEALCDDMNTPIALSHIFDAVRLINIEKEKKGTLSKGDIETLVRIFDDVVYGVLGLKDEAGDNGKAGKTINGLMDMVLEERKAAKDAKNWALSDSIRDHLKALGITVKDTKDGAEWTLE
jgi:cysteinyl-tRNA synthetase